jgi:hypothetical protein
MNTTVGLDDCLSIRAGRLWMEECETVELARRFGTPLYAVSEDQLRRNARRISAAFAAGWPGGETALLPSLKANLGLALRAVLNSEGLGCDTFGPGELHAALTAGTIPELISVNGSVKDAELIRHAVAAGARVTLDSPGELDLAAAAARACGRAARVRLRLRPVDAARRSMPPQAGIRPSRAWVKPMRASSQAIRKSQAMATSAPPPRAAPLIAAITGTGSEGIRSSEARMAPAICLAKASSRCDSSSFKSPPAMKARSPAPVMTAQWMSARSARSARWASSSRIVEPASAFRAWGRSTVSTSTRPSCRTLISAMGRR